MKLAEQVSSRLERLTESFPYLPSGVRITSKTLIDILVRVKVGADSKWEEVPKLVPKNLNSKNDIFIIVNLRKNIRLLGSWNHDHYSLFDLSDKTQPEISPSYGDTMLSNLTKVTKFINDRYSTNVMNDSTTKIYVPESIYMQTYRGQDKKARDLANASIVNYDAKLIANWISSLLETKKDLVIKGFTEDINDMFATIDKTLSMVNRKDVERELKSEVYKSYDSLNNRLYGLKHLSEKFIYYMIDNMFDVDNHQKKLTHEDVLSMKAELDRILSGK